MAGRFGRGVFILFVALVATVLGTVTALLWTPPGRGLLARLVMEETRSLFRGSVEIGGVSGGFTRSFSLQRLVIRDSTGAVFADIPRLDVSYRIPDFMAGRFVFMSATLQAPRFRISKRRSTGRMNYEEILRLGEGSGGGTARLIEIRDLHVTGGHVTLSLPWNPDGRLRTEAQKDSALAAERAKPGRRIEPGPEGLTLVRTVRQLNADFPLLRLATPDRQAVVVEIAGLEGVLSDPALDIRELRGALRTKNDSLLFELAHVELPGTEGRGQGRIDWPQDTIQYRFTLDAPRLALADIRFVSPFFPDYTGRARVSATSVSNQRTEWAIGDLSVGDDASRIDGSLVAITDINRGLGFRALRLDLRNVDLNVPRPYLDTLPFHGRVSGRLEADGFFDGMTVALDWDYQDSSIEGGASNQLAMAGRVRFGGPDGMTFTEARLRQSDLDLRTVRQVAPAVILQGRLGLDGTLNGPWRNVVFDGTITHRDGELPVSRVVGPVRLDTRGEMLGLEARLTLDSLSFDGIRRGFPGLTVQGTIGGRMNLSGRLDSMMLDGAVGGALGDIEVRGHAILTPPRWGTDSMFMRFERLNLARVTPNGPATRLNGTLTARGIIDTAGIPQGRLQVRLGPGMAREIRFDSALAIIRGDGPVIRVDTASLQWEGGRLDGRGAIGWRAPASDTIRIVADIRDLGGFDSLARALTGANPDTSGGNEGRLRGRAAGEFFVTGAVDTLELDGKGTIPEASFAGVRIWNLEAEGSWSTAGPHFTIHVETDSVTSGSLGLSALVGEAYGRPDSLEWNVGTFGRRFARLDAEGALVTQGDTRHLRIGTLDLELLDREWKLAGPANALITREVVRLDTVRFRTEDGSGSVEVAGEIPGDVPGELTVTAVGIRIEDLYALTQRDTADIDGTVTLDMRVGGVAAAPTIRGLATVTGPVFRDFQSPMIRAGLDYRDRRLRSDVTFWRTGKPVVEVSAELPLDLALRATESRQLPGQISIVARGDSVDLAIVEAFTPNIRRVQGRLDMDARIEGTWENPRLAGTLSLSDGALTVPALGVRYTGIAGTVRLSGDSILAEPVRLENGPGWLDITGGVRLAGLTRPEFALTLDARDFRFIDVPEYLTLTAWGTIRLSGPIFQPAITGEGALTNSAIYFADLITKDVINLEDPRLAELVDTVALRRQDLRAPFQSRFLDSLEIRNLELRLGQDVWLRSNEANIQLEGNRIRVNKIRDVYRIAGELDAVRGTYTLRLPGIVRTFTVDQGVVRYFGDLDAEVDITARHEVRTPEATGDVSIIAHITGKLSAPRLELRAPDRPGLSEQALISLLAFGTEDPRGLGVGQEGAGGLARAVAAYISSVVSSEIAAEGAGRTADIIEIRPPLASSGLAGGSQALQLAIGTGITEKLFVIANAGFCVGQNQQRFFNARNVGASLEYRFRRELKVLVAAEPVVSCFGQGADIYGPPRRYQFGAELRWDREY